MLTYLVQCYDENYDAVEKPLVAELPDSSDDEGQE